MIWIDHRDAHKQNAHRLPGPLLHFAAIGSIQQRFGIDGQINTQQVGLIELAENVNHFVLCRSHIRIAVSGQSPCVIDLPFAIKQSHEVMSHRIESEEVVADGVMDNVPVFASKELAGHLHMWPECRGKPTDA